jgi:hypothetical protein
MRRIQIAGAVLMTIALAAIQFWTANPAAMAQETMNEPSPIAPAVSTHTGLLLEPPLDLSWFTREKFIAASSTVGSEKIQKAWTSSVVKLPEHSRVDAQGLTHGEIKQYMVNAKRLFDEGKAIPMSDVGLISTQEDVIREPMLNHISAFENTAVRVYLLVQRTLSGQEWGYFTIVQDMTLDPPLDYYAQILPTEVKFEGTSCFECHTSGPLAIHPAREDLVLDAKLAAALSQRIAEQPMSRFYFPPHAPRPDAGKKLTLSTCTACHDEEGIRGPLFQFNSHPIRVLVDFGYMPPDEPLSPEEIAKLKAWLDDVE